MANFEELVKELSQIVRRGNEIIIELRNQQISGTFKESSDNTTKKETSEDSKGTVKIEGLENKVSSALRKLSVPANIKGYSYSRTAIIMAITDPKLVHAVTKELYPKVAEQYGTTPSRVERAIRHAIEVAWTRADTKDFEELIGYSKDSRDVKPTNSEFIAVIADRILLSE